MVRQIDRICYCAPEKMFSRIDISARGALTEHENGPERNTLMTRRPGNYRIFAIIISALFAGNIPGQAASHPAATRTVVRHASIVHHRVAFANPTKDDVAAFDDPVVRDAAVDALGRNDGSVVAIDPTSGRILSIVNQKLAFSSGFIPCSTIKPVIAVAALQEGVVTRDTMIRVAPRKYFNLTEALAHSNNAFFEELGRRMGFETVSHYGRLLGLGELAGYQIPEEHPGAFPSEPPALGGVARMSSFGEGIEMTPLQLGALVSSIANGGTLYYLQYPRTAEERAEFCAARETQSQHRGPAAGSARRHAGSRALRDGAAQLYFR